MTPKKQRSNFCPAWSRRSVVKRHDNRPKSAGGETKKKLDIELTANGCGLYGRGLYGWLLMDPRNPPEIHFNSKTNAEKVISQNI